MSVNNIKQLKIELRRVCRQARTELINNGKKELDKILAERFLSLNEYKDCKTLFAYVSTEFEVDTSFIISSALNDGKRVAVPKCTDEFGNMDFYYITSIDCLKKGAYSIMEPDETLCTKVSDFSDGLCLVPGLCFENQGYRLGYGKGYYDRFLEHFFGTSVGLCYSSLVQSRIPVDVYDKNVDILITENNINYTSIAFKRNDTYEP